MATRSPKGKARAGGSSKKGWESMIISKTRVKGAVKKCNVGGEFYDALEGAVREIITRAEDRALANRRKTLRASDV